MQEADFRRALLGAMVSALGLWQTALGATPGMER